jgi:hypothetical protein
LLKSGWTEDTLKRIQQRSEKDTLKGFWRTKNKSERI